MQIRYENKTNDLFPLSKSSLNKRHAKEEIIDYMRACTLSLHKSIQASQFRFTRIHTVYMWKKNQTTRVYTLIWVFTFCTLSYNVIHVITYQKWHLLSLEEIQWLLKPLKHIKRYLFWWYHILGTVQMTVIYVHMGTLVILICKGT